MLDLYPLFNSIRIALISTFITFCIGIFSAYYISKAPKAVKGMLDVVLTLPLVLPPTVIGFFILKAMGPKGIAGSLFMDWFGVKLVMAWYSAIFATVIVTFPLMYRTVRGAFESFDMTLKYAGQTLGLSNTYIFWRIMMPYCKQGILAGTVLAFARALGEYGATSMVAGYTPGITATISTTVYQLWREGNDALAYKWVAVNLVISFVVLVSINLLERRYKNRTGKKTHVPMMEV
jgi:molybdate transport system permease protein